MTSQSSELIHVSGAYSRNDSTLRILQMYKHIFLPTDLLVPWYLFMNNTLFSDFVKLKNINVIMYTWEQERPFNRILFISTVVDFEEWPHEDSKTYLAVFCMAIPYPLTAEHRYCYCKIEVGLNINIIQFLFLWRLADASIW